MSRTLGFTVVAEGVETEEQLGILRELNCDIVQGYLISKPISADELLEKFADKI
jgi:EAL domain-containing protein (putative c-di-GMP-specific phosphodiesterase class I)